MTAISKRLSAYAVVQRTRELGISVALGASRRNILMLVLAQGMTLVVIGLALGLAGAFGRSVGAIASRAPDLSTSSPSSYLVELEKNPASSLFGYCDRR